MTRKDRWHGVGLWEKTTATITWVAASAAMMALLLTGCSAAAPKPAPVISIADTRIPESDGGPTQAEFSVVLTPASEQVITVDYTTENGTAEAGKDYVATKGTLTFAAGETTKTISVAVIDDGLVEPYETFAVTLSSPSNATLADARATALGTVTNDDTKIYFTYDGSEHGTAVKVLRADLDGSNVEELVTSGLSEARGIALDIAGGVDKVYYTDHGARKIWRANLDGSDVEAVVTIATHPWDIALDGAGGKMYYVGGDRIWRADLDGSTVEELVSVPPGLVAIALDIAGGKMYWANRGNEGKIQRANLDGSEVEDVIVDARWPHPRALDLDASAGKIYWSSRDGPRGRFQIFRANLDGSDIEELVSEGVGSPLSIALDIDEGKMYWADYWGGTVQRANLDGSDVEDVVTEPRSFPSAIALALR